MRSRHPIGTVVEVDGPTVLTNLLDVARGQVVGHQDGVSAFEQPGDLVAVEAGSILLVARVLRIAFAEPKAVVRYGRDGDEPLRQLRAQIIGSLHRTRETLVFQPRTSHLPVLGASLVPLSREEISAILSQSLDDKGILLGFDSRTGTVPISADIDSLLSRHVAVLGGTGQGKTHFVAYMAQTLASHPQSRIVIFDVNGEYHSALSHFPGFKRTVIGRDRPPATGYRIPYFALGRQGLIRLLMPSERAQAPALRFALEHLPFVEFLQGGAKPASQPGVPVFFDDCNAADARPALVGLKVLRDRRTPADLWPDFRAIGCLVADFYCIQEDRGAAKRNGFNYGHISSLINRIHSLVSDENFASVVDISGGTLVGGNARPLSMVKETEAFTEEIFGSADFGEDGWNVHVLDLSALSADLMPFVLGALLDMYAEALFRRGPGGTHPTLLVLEEAHHYLRQIGGLDDNGEGRSYERLAKEGRKFGISLLVSTQRPSELSPTVLSQMGTWLTFRLTSESDQRAVLSAAESSNTGIVAQLPGLGRGEALAFGNAVPIPVRINVCRPSPTPDSADPPFSKLWASTSKL